MFVWFSQWGVTRTRVSFRVGAGFTGREHAGVVGTGGSRSAGCGQGAQACDRLPGQLGPGGFSGEVEQDPSAGAGQGGRHGEQASPKPFGFPPARVVAGEGEHVHPRGSPGR